MAIYTVPTTGTFTNANGNYDLFEITPAAEKPVRIVGIYLSNTSEIGDTMEEALQFSIIRVPTTLTSGNGGAVTPVAINDIDAAAGFAAETFSATVATTSGTLVTVAQFSWNIRNSPYELWFPDERMQIRYRRSAGTAQALVVRMDSTVVDDVSIVATLFVEEL